MRQKIFLTECIIASPDGSLDPYSFFSHIFYTIILGFMSFFTGSHLKTQFQVFSIF